MVEDGERAAAGPVVRGPVRPGPLQATVLGYLALLPVGHFLVLPTEGVWATGADVLLGILVLVALLSWIRGWATREASEAPSDPGALVTFLPAALLLVFAAWVASSSLWGPHPGYARLKGLGFAALATGALAIGASRVHWRRVMDAWLVGTALALAATWIPIVLGLDGLRDRVVHVGGLADGFPLRVRGPFLHPNMFGDYLVVSAALLWSRWEVWRRARPVATLAFGGLLLLTLAATVSSAWVQAGVVMFFVGLSTLRRRGGRPWSLRRPVPAALVVGGLALTAAATAGLLAPLEVGVGPVRVETAGIRPDIWGSSMEAVRAAPLGGVGAAPFVAAAADPRGPGRQDQLWDAHSLYLSLAAQFGVVGLALFGAALVLLLRNLVRSGVSPGRIAVLLALGSMAVHGLFTASEELRHGWALLGIAILLTHREGVREAQPPPQEVHEAVGAAG